MRFEHTSAATERQRFRHTFNRRHGANAFKLCGFGLFVAFAESPYGALKVTHPASLPSLLPFTKHRLVGADSPCRWTAYRVAAPARCLNRRNTPIDIALIIPARYASSRFPGKPLVDVLGRSLLARTCAIARAAGGVRQVFVTTDARRIADAARALGVEVLMTTQPCATGSDRVALALQQISPLPEGVINLQGDALLTPPWVLEALVAALAQHGGMVTPALQLDRERYQQFVESKQRAPSSGTTVTLDKQGRALYFSKAIIPYLRQPGEVMPPVYRHIGVYGYDTATLLRFASLPQSSLERAEGLEQLRALENGIPIQVVPVDYRGRTHWSIDAPGDVAVAEEIITREGELT